MDANIHEQLVPTTTTKMPPSEIDSDVGPQEREFWQSSKKWSGAEILDLPAGPIHHFVLGARGFDPGDAAGGEHHRRVFSGKLVGCMNDYGKEKARQYWEQTYPDKDKLPRDASLSRDVEGFIASHGPNPLVIWVVLPDPLTGKKSSIRITTFREAIFLGCELASVNHLGTSEAALFRKSLRSVLQTSLINFRKSAGKKWNTLNLISDSILMHKICRS